MTQITAFLIDSDTSSTAHISTSLMNLGSVRVAGTANCLQEAMQAIQVSAPDIVILEVKELERGLKEVELLLSRSPHSTAFVSSAAVSPEWILKLIRAGAREYLTRPISSGELADAVNTVAKTRATTRDPVREGGEIISVYHPMGGVGTTTIAVNLAAALAAGGRSTVLVDLNLLGEASAFLDLAPRYTLADVVPKAGSVDASFLRSIVTPHRCGVLLLDTPEQPAQAARIAPELVREVLAVLRTMFDNTVIDTGGEPFGRNLAAFQMSDCVLFTTVLDIPRLRTAKRCLGALAGEGLAPNRVRLVVNRHQARDEIRISDAEKVLNEKVYHTVPNSYQDLSHTINKGIPLTAHLPRSPFSRSIEVLTKTLCMDRKTGAQATHKRG